MWIFICTSEVKRGHQIPWNWICGCLCSSTWVWGMGAMSSVRVPQKFTFKISRHGDIGEGEDWRNGSVL